MVCPSEMCCARSLATKSLPPPGAFPTISRTGLFGYDSLDSAAIALTQAASERTNTQPWLLVVIANFPENLRNHLFRFDSDCLDQLRPFRHLGADHLVEFVR